jgi:cytoskeleton protein RodZ
MALTGKDVGACLREARERRGLSLRQIAGATRISVQALDAIERNDIRRLPGGIFSRAFVRGYAHEVGLDPEETVRDFVEQFPVEAVTYGSPLVEPPTVDGVRSLDPDLKPWPNLLIIGAALAVGVVGLTLAVLWARGALTASASSDSPGPAAPPLPSSSAQTASARTASAPATSVAEPLSPSRGQNGAAPATGATAASASAPLPADGLHITVSSDAPCWARIVADGVVRYEGLLEKGVSETRDARRTLVLTVGDAGACQVTINGRRLRPLGAAGRVVTLRVTPDTLPGVLAQ